MQTPSAIPSLRAAALAATLTLLAAGCATTDIPPPEPFRTSQVEAFLKPARDPRELGITTLTDPASGKPHFEFANRTHMDRSAELPMLRKGYPCAVLDLKTGAKAPLRVLVDTTSRQSWLVPSECAAMDYRPVKPPLGEYPDHVDSQVPGYAGIANKIIAVNFHVESPVFYVPMAYGHLGPLSRPAPSSAGDAPDAGSSRRSNAKFCASIQAVLGCEMLRNLSWIRFDFPRRAIRISSSSSPYKPPVADAVTARLPMLDWRGRPAIAVRIDGHPATAVLDTGGDFELSLPDPAASSSALLEIGTLSHRILPDSHDALDLPADFPPRIGARFLARYAVTLDFKTRCIWFEDPDLAAQRQQDAGEEEDDIPTQYRGIVR